MYFSGVLYAIKNGIEHIKKYNLWHRAQILIFNGIEHMCYIFLRHTGNFLVQRQRPDAIGVVGSSHCRCRCPCAPRSGGVHLFPVSLQRGARLGTQKKRAHRQPWAINSLSPAGRGADYGVGARPNPLPVPIAGRPAESRRAEHSMLRTFGWVNSVSGTGKAGDGTGRRPPCLRAPSPRRWRCRCENFSTMIPCR
jgi:hypothetical protein